MWVKIGDELINASEALYIFKEDYSTDYVDLYRISIIFSHQNTTIEFDSETDRDIAFIKLTTSLVKN